MMLNHTTVFKFKRIHCELIIQNYEFRFIKSVSFYKYLFILTTQGCGPGNYSAKTGRWTFSRTCKICPIGTYKDTDITYYSCTACPEGQTNDQKGSTSVQQCKPSKTYLIYLML